MDVHTVIESEILRDQFPMPVGDGFPPPHSLGMHPCVRTINATEQGSNPATDCVRG
eukprot:jgi/Psemu1/308433/fgenesh1_kg.411_\